MKILICLFLCVNAFAGFPLVKFDGVYGEFELKEGRAFAKNAKYDLEQVKIAHKEIDVKFNNREKNLVINDNNTTVELKFDFSFLNVFQSFSFDGVSMDSSAKAFDLALDNLALHIKPKDYNAEGLKVSSDLSVIDAEDLPSGDIDILDGFVLNGSISFKKLIFGNVDAQNIMLGLISENPDREVEIRESFTGLKSIPLKLRNLMLSTQKGRITGRVILDSWINANLYIGGQLVHKKKQNNLEITLTRAKLGYFSIKRLVLKEIRNLGVDAITVKGNLIVVDLGKVISTSTLK
jgi:hypothetical protein